MAVQTVGANRPLRVLVHSDLPGSSLDEIRAAAGMGSTVLVLPDPGEALRRLPEAEVAFGHFPPAAIAGAAPALRWLQVSSAGVDGYISDEVKACGVILTNSSGVYGVAGAEHLLGQMLMFARRLGEMRDSQRAGRWDNERFRAIATLRGQIAGVVGLGDIGTQVALRARAFGMEVVAVKRRPATPPPFVSRLLALDGLPELLPICDHLILCLPLTPQTRGLIDAEALARMKPTAYLYNIGRGAVIDEPALIRCLQEGRIAGAALDVFVEEPLPPHSPLWTLPNVLITPHVGANGPRDWEDAASLFARNLERYRSGQPLLNVVDLDLGY